MKSSIQHYSATENSWFKITHKSLIYLSAIAMTTLLCSAVFGPLKSPQQNDNYVAPAKMKLTVLNDNTQNKTYQIRQNVTFQVGEDHFLNGNVLFAFPDFFDQYDIDFMVGDLSTALKDSKSVIITEEIADKIFRSKNPDCQIIRCGTANVECQLKVTGIIRDLPSNGGIEVDYIVSAALLENLENH